jgi:urease accessory protein
MEMTRRSHFAVIPALVAGIQPDAGTDASGAVDPGHEARDDHVVRSSSSRSFAAVSAALLLALAWLVLASGTAEAHTGLEHAVSFATGFKHPWTGIDHMLAMVAVGLWAGLNGGRALWAWPAAFVGLMVAGGVLGITGVPVPMVEPGILTSVIVLGLLVLAAARLPVALGAALVALFALLHGHAHGSELPGEAAAATYAAGFALATALLHAIGLGVAHLADGATGRTLVRGAGALVAVVGVALAVS